MCLGAIWLRPSSRRKRGSTKSFGLSPLFPSSASFAAPNGTLTSIFCRSLQIPSAIAISVLRSQMIVCQNSPSQPPRAPAVCLRTHHDSLTDRYVHLSPLESAFMPKPHAKSFRMRFYVKHPGVGGGIAPRTSSCCDLHSPFVFRVLRIAFRVGPFFKIIQIAQARNPKSAKGLRASVPVRYCLYFQLLADSLACWKKSTPLESTRSRLFLQNTRRWGIALLSVVLDAAHLKERAWLEA